MTNIRLDLAGKVHEVIRTKHILSPVRGMIFFTFFHVLTSFYSSYSRRNRTALGKTMLPPIPTIYSGDDIDVILGGADQNQCAELSAQRVTGPLRVWRSAVKTRLVDVRETSGMENAAFFLWLTLGSYWRFVDENLELLFGDPHFLDRPPPYTGAFV